MAKLGYKIKNILKKKTLISRIILYKQWLIKFNGRLPAYKDEVFVLIKRKE